MISRSSSRDDQAVPQQQPQTPPPGYGVDHSFTLQTVMELQKSTGQLLASVDEARRSIDKLGEKVDELMAFKNKVLGIAAVLTIVAGILGAVFAKGVEYLFPR